MINSFNHFRAIAIIFIVAGHAYSIGSIHIDNSIEVFLSNIVLGGTALFVFISGFLFHSVFHRKLVIQKFLLSKLKNVFVPYLLLAAVPIMMRILSRNADFNGYYLPTTDGVLGHYIIPYLKYLWTGNFLTAYWYIPFIIATFLLTPLHARFVTLARSTQMSLIVVLSAIALLIHRPVDNIGLIQSVVYYSPIYLLGIFCSIYRNSVYLRLAGFEMVILAATVALSVLQTVIGHVGNYHKLPFEWGGIDLMFLQKVLLCLFFMVWLNRFEARSSTLINIVAATSFTTFFFHPILLHIVATLKLSPQTESWIFYIGLVAAVMAGCVVMALTIKRLVPKYSRYLTGY